MVGGEAVKLVGYMRGRVDRLVGRLRTEADERWERWLKTQRWLELPRWAAGLGTQARGMLSERLLDGRLLHGRLQRTAQPAKARPVAAPSVLKQESAAKRESAPRHEPPVRQPVNASAEAQPRPRVVARRSKGTAEPATATNGRSITNKSRSKQGGSKRGRGK